MRKRKKPGKKLKLNKKLRIPKIDEELKLKEQGFKNIAGLDEVGRGALAAPLVAAACILPKDKRLYSLRDSKLLNGKEREKLAKKIKREARGWSIGVVEHGEIEKLGLHKAGLLAFFRALKKLKIKPDFILIDAYRLPNHQIPYKNLKKGDMVCTSIAAASILAKVYRDNLMKKLALKYPGYFFEENKGYGTKKHLEALRKLGPCEIHRRNFGPVRKFGAFCVFF